MRMAYVCADRGIPVFGQKGCSVHIQEVVRSLGHHQVEVELLASRYDGNAPGDLSYVKTHSLLKVGKQTDFDFSVQIEQLNAEIYSLLEQLGPWDAVYERYSLWSTAAMRYAFEHRIPGILEVNAPLIVEEQMHRSLIQESLAVECEAKVFQKSAVIIGVSGEVCDYVRARVPVSSRPLIEVVPNGINPQRFKQVSEWRNQYHDPAYLTLGFLGTLKPWHGVEILLEAFSILCAQKPHLRLLIVGDGPQKEMLKTTIAHKGLTKKVTLTGAVDPAQVGLYLCQMDVAVAPYPLMDHFYFSPLKVYEYMAAGLPVVASRIGQLESLIDHEVNGLLFTPGDVESLVKAIDRLIQDAHLRSSISLVARQQMLEQYTWDHGVAKILKLADQAKQAGLGYVEIK